MTFYYRAGWKFYLALFIQWALTLGGILLDNSWMIFIAMLAALPLWVWMVHITIVDNKSGGK